MKFLLLLSYLSDCSNFIYLILDFRWIYYHKFFYILFLINMSKVCVKQVGVFAKRKQCMSVHVHVGYGAH